MVKFRENGRKKFVTYQCCHSDSHHLKFSHIKYKFTDFQYVSSLPLFTQIISNFVDNFKKDNIFALTWMFLNSAKNILFL